jgi:uncharacterized protein (TIRG00374 family)
MLPMLRMSERHEPASNQAIATDATISVTKRWTLTSIKCVVSAALIYSVLRGTSLAEIFTALGEANIPLLLLAVSLDSLGYFLMARRWRQLLKAQGVDASMQFVLKSCMAGGFFNNILPSTIGGDAIRVYDCWRLGLSRAGAVAVVFVDRFLGLTALMLFVLYALATFGEVMPNLSLPYLWILSGAAGMFAVIWMIFMPSQHISARIANFAWPLSGKMRNFLSKIDDGFSAFKGRKDALAIALGLSLILQINVVLQYYVIAKALGFPISLDVFFLIIPLAIFMMMIPVSINGIGIRENILAVFFGMFGVSKPEAIAFAWILYGIGVLWGFLGGVVYVLRR